jgi:hypothetical protein
MHMAVTSFSLVGSWLSQVGGYVHTKDALDILAYLCGIAVAVTVGRNNLKKQTIADQANLIVVLHQEIALLKEQNAGQEQRIKCLEGKLDGNAQVVGRGPVALGHRKSSGNSPASPQTPKNRNP